MCITVDNVVIGFDELISSVHKTNGASNTVSTTQDQIQYNNGDLTIVLGFGSLRVIVVDNDKSASITFTPVEIEVGTFKLDRGLQLSLYSTTYRDHRESMFIGGGELFQLSTLYDFDFGIVKEIVPKYLELLESLRDSSQESKIHMETYELAVTAIRDLATKYAEE